MQTIVIGKGDEAFPASRLAYGCMRIAGTWNPDEIDDTRRESAFAALAAAYEAGFTLFDHADIYCRGGCEALHGEFFARRPDLRAKTLVATKCGIRFRNDPPGTVGRYDFSKEHILLSCEQSLARLQIDRIDLYQLHRPDLLMNPEEVAAAFVQLHRQGKVRTFGVSNFLPSTVDLLQKWLPFPIAVNQIEVSLWRLEPLFDGTLDQCLREGIVPLSWGPLGGGRVGGATGAGTVGVEPLEEALAEVAKSHNVDSAMVALAWLLKQPSGIVPIVGSVRPVRIAASASALDVELSREEWYRLLVAARGEPMP